MRKLAILLADDEPSIRLTVSDALCDAGHETVVAADGAEALARLGNRDFDLVVTDVRMPKANGLAVFEAARKAPGGTDVILMTAYAEVQDAVDALKAGASDYMTKPFDIDELILRVERIAERRELEHQLQEARAELEAAGASAQIIGRAPSMRRLLDRIQTMGGTEFPVLITGESGTGKELVARALHDASPRVHRPFVAVNCAAFPETLLEAELFGHAEGAFTGAVRERAGRFVTARGGTLLLDEVAEIPITAQAKLLRVLQEGVVEPLGSDRSVAVDVRILAATHRDLLERIKQGAFREDLYYRLNVLDLNVPPLRERKGDLPALIEHFMLRRTQGGEPPAITPAAWAVLSQYNYPGNVRELQHAIERAMVLSRGTIVDVDGLPEVMSGQARAPGTEASGEFLPLSVATKAFERQYLVRALRRVDGKKTQAAELLGISRKNLWEKLKGHGIESSDAERER